MNFPAGSLASSSCELFRRSLLMGASPDEMGRLLFPCRWRWRRIQSRGLLDWIPCTQMWQISPLWSCPLLGAQMGLLIPPSPCRVTQVTSSSLCLMNREWAPVPPGSLPAQPRLTMAAATLCQSRQVWCINGSPAWSISRPGSEGPQAHLALFNGKLLVGILNPMRVATSKSTQVWRRWNRWSIAAG